jgi:hypothetical protein
LPWIDASWLFDALTGVAVKFLGLRGLPFLAMMFACVTAIAVFVFARGARRGLWSGVALTAIALYLLARLPLRPSLVSVVFFTILLKVLLDTPSTAKQRSLYLLPPLFVIWANLDIQFVYGLAALMLFLITGASVRLVRRSTSIWQGQPVALPTTAIVTAASIATTLINPYGYRLWGAALRSVNLFATDPYRRNAFAALPPASGLRLAAAGDDCFLCHWASPRA